MPTITTRSIIEQKGHYYITLPNAWVKYNGCTKGDSLGVNMNGDLHLIPNPGTQDRIMKLVYKGGALTVSLPIEWVRANNFQKGDKVEVIANGELIIRPVKTSAVKL